MPIHVVSRIFGLVPFTIARAPNGEVEGARVHKCDLLWFVAAIIIYIFLAYSYIDTNEIHCNSNQSYILTVGDNVLISLGLVIAAAVIVMDMYNRSRIIEIPKQFINFDKRVSWTFFSFWILLNKLHWIFFQIARLGIYFDYKHRWRIVLILYLGAMLMCFILTMFTFFNYGKIQEKRTFYGIMSFICSHMLHHCAMSTILNNYFVQTYYLCERFDILNSLLR